MDDTMLITAAESQPQEEPAVEETAAVQGDELEAEDAMATKPASEADGESPETAAPEQTDYMLTVKHDHKLHSLSREDAERYAQKGMQYDAVSPMLEKLKYIAASEGKSLTELVDSIGKQNEDDLYSRLLERCGDEEIAKELLKVEQDKRKAAYESLLESEKTAEAETEEAITKRVAEEFEELRAEFPQLTEFSKVPQAVVRESMQKGIPLLDAYLRYEHRESAKAAAAKAAQESAAKASTGTQAGAGGNTASPVEAALMRGIWG